MKSRQDAWELVNEFVENSNLVKHMLAVETGMRAYARKMGGDEELWASVGLVHDFDWERHPQEPDHPVEGAKILRERGWPEEIIRAVLSHSDLTGVSRTTDMEKALYAVDELTGLIAAVVLVRPSKDIREVKIKSIKKKWNDRRFAAGVDRQLIERGAAELGVSLDEHIQIVLEAMQGVASELGLDG